MARPRIVAAAEPTATRLHQRQAQIGKAAVRLFSERGYYQTTIEDVAQAADISKGLVYRYFKNKDDLLFYCLRYVLEKYEPEDVRKLIADRGPLGALNDLFTAHCTLAEEHIREVVLAYKSTSDLSAKHRREIKVLESRIVRTIRQALEACVHGGLMHAVDLDIMAYQYVMYGHTWALKNWSYADRYTNADYLREGRNLLILPHLTKAGLVEFKRIRAE